MFHGNQSASFLLNDFYRYSYECEIGRVGGQPRHLDQLVFVTCALDACIYTTYGKIPFDKIEDNLHFLTALVNNCILQSTANL